MPSPGIPTNLLIVAYQRAMKRRHRIRARPRVWCLTGNRSSDAIGYHSFLLAVTVANISANKTW